MAESRRSAKNSIVSYDVKWAFEGLDYAKFSIPHPE